MDKPELSQTYDAFGNIIPGDLGSKSPKSNPGVVYQPANEPTNPGALKIARQTSENIVFKTKDGGTINIGTQDTSPSTTDGEPGISILGKGKDPNQEEKFVQISQGKPVAALFTSRPLTTTEQRDTPIPWIQIFDDSLQEDAAVSIGAENASDAIVIAQDGNGYGIDIESNQLQNWLGVWSAVTTYSIDDAVIDNLNNNGYVSIVNSNTNNQPSTDGGVHWKLVGNKEAIIANYKGAGNPVTISNTNNKNFNSALQISTNAIISSHWCKVMNLNAVGHSIHVYTGDGTDPNGALTGRLGDIVLNASATGGIAYCDTDNSTSWTIL